MQQTNSLPTLLVLAFAFAFGISTVSSDVPTFSPDDPEAARIRVEDVTPYSKVFLSDTKSYPAFDMGNNTVLRVELEEPSNDDKAMNAARKAIGETRAVMESAKRKLAALLKNDDELNVPWQNDAWLIRFLRARNYDVRKTYKLIRSYYNLKAKKNEYFENLVPSTMRDVAETGMVTVLPKRDPAGNRIIIASPKNWDPKKFSIVQLMRIGFVFAETGAYEPATQLTGVHLLFDADGLTWQHVRQYTPAIARFSVQYILSSSPVKVTSMHVLNTSLLSWTMFNIMRPFMTEDFRNKIFMHGSDWKTLHQYIPATSLPDTYGGTFPMPKLSSFEWDILLKSGDEELAKIGSYGIKRRT